MQPLTAAAGGAPYSQSSTPAPRDPNAILNECRAVGRAIDDLEGRLQELQRVQRGFTSGNGTTNKEIDSMSADIMTGYRGLGDRVKRIKGQREASEPRNKQQVDALDRRIRKAINAYQQVESQFRKEVQDQQRRQYLIVNPEASESEIREATQDGGDTQIFQQALLNSDRRGQAQSTLRNVQQRHDAIQQIERTMMELQQLFQDLDAIVVQQEPMVQNIEQKAEETNTHLEAGNVHVGRAVNSARAARKKKWICLGICGKWQFIYTARGYRKFWLTWICSCRHHHYHHHCARLPRRQRHAQRRQQQQRPLGERQFPHIFYVSHEQYPHFRNNTDFNIWHCTVFIERRIMEGSKTAVGCKLAAMAGISEWRAWRLWVRCWIFTKAALLSFV